jgi:hypothetical protein
MVAYMAYIQSRSEVKIFGAVRLLSPTSVKESFIPPQQITSGKKDHLNVTIELYLLMYKTQNWSLNLVLQKLSGQQSK